MSTQKRRPRTPTQLELRARTWGGRRPGAGRPKKKNAGAPHLARPALASRYPVHITTSVLPHVWNLRTKRCFVAIRMAFEQGAERFGFRIVHYSVQGNHIHLIVEAKHATALARGMQGLKVRLARALNRVMGTKGRVFAERYHSRILRSPTETHRALMYVLLNARRHAKTHGRTYGPGWVDPYSSAVFFKPFGKTWVERCAVFPRDNEAVGPKTWLLREGWLRGGRADPNKIPGPV